jgi:environmental stress-induced protein Ves
MSVILIPSTKYKSTPWKNGGGITEEIAIYPPNAKFPDDEFLWRLSSASFGTGGPFSLFPKHQRYLLLVDGNPIRLKMGSEDREHLLRQGDVITFPGHLQIISQVDGPVRDLNFMFNQNAGIQASLQKVGLNSGEEIKLSDDTSTVHFVYVIRGSIIAGISPKVQAAATRGDTIRIEGSSSITFKAKENSSVCVLGVKHSNVSKL